MTERDPFADKIAPEDSTMDAMVKLSEGNPGAATALAELVQQENGELALLTLDAERIYGADIWVLYKDMCDADIDCVIEKLMDGVSLDDVREARFP